MNPLPLLEESAISTSPVAARGFGALETSSGALPLSAMSVAIAVVDLGYETRIEQTFVNAYDEPLEASYVFPLPSRAAVSDFELTVAGRTVAGVLQERGEARRNYQDAIRAGKRAALAEEDRSSVFTMTVGNIMPGEEARVMLKLRGLVSTSGTEAELRFPLVVAPRYCPGRALPGPSVGDGTSVDTDEVPDASRISPPVLLEGFPNPVALSLSVDVTSGQLSFTDFTSSLHAVSQSADDNVTKITVYPGERLNRDFVLRFKVAAEEITSSVALAHDKTGDEGTFMLTVVPSSAETAVTRPRDIVFVLDRSGSMSGWKMVCARRAIARMVETLTERDRFRVVAFDTQVETPPGHESGLSNATDSQRFAAEQWLGRVDARGGTQMREPITSAVNLLAQSPDERDRVLVLVTDGQVSNEQNILDSIGASLHRVRVFTLGIDRAVNEGFLTRLASAGGGACELVESEERLNAVMDRIHRQIGTPVLSDLSVSTQGAELVSDTLAPSRVPGLFAGAPLRIFGRFSGTHEARLPQVVLSGLDLAGNRWQTTVVPKSTDAGPLVSALWARASIRELEDQYDSGRFADAAQLQRDIVDRSLRFGVLSRFTAFVATDDEVVNEGGRNVRAMQPVERPDGWVLNQARASLAPAVGSLEDTKECLYSLDIAAPPQDNFFTPAPSAPAPKPRASVTPRAPAMRLERALGDAKNSNNASRLQTPSTSPDQTVRKQIKARSKRLLAALEAEAHSGASRDLTRKLVDQLQEIHSLVTGIHDFASPGEIDNLKKLITKLESRTRSSNSAERRIMGLLDPILKTDALAYRLWQALEPILRRIVMSVPDDPNPTKPSPERGEVESGRLVKLECKVLVTRYGQALESGGTTRLVKELARDRATLTGLLDRLHQSDVSASERSELGHKIADLRQHPADTAAAVGLWQTLEPVLRRVSATSP